MNRRRRLHCKVTASASRRLQMETLEKRRLLAVFDVTTTDDVVDDSDGQLSLREAITAANVNGSSEVDVINIPAGTYTLTRDGADENGNSTGDLDINTPVTIRGVGQGNTTIDAGGDTGIQDRVFQTLGQHEVTFEDLTIRGGRITGSSGGGLFVSGVSDSLVTLRRVTVLDNVASAAGQGGGITVTTQGSLVIEESSVSGNSSPQAGGILNFGTLDVIASSIRGNETDNLGGGIQNGADAVARILNSTIANNNALNGGGIANFNGTLSVTQSTLSGNVASSLSGAVLTIASGTDAEATSTVFQSTIVGSTQADAGAVHVTTQSGASSATTSLGSSVFEGNSGGERDVSSSENGQLVSLGHNASEGSGFSVLTQTGDVTNISLPIVDPSLADNGGPTLTHALLPGSPAIDGGPPDALAGFDGIPEFDQRGSGFDRVFDGDGDLTPRIDIGAFEWNASSVVDFTQVVRLNEAGNQIEIEVNGLVTNLISPPIDVIEAIGGDGVDTVIIEDIGDLVSGSIPLRFDAGGGGDVVRLAGAGQVLDVTSLPEGAITGLETIDLRGTGDNTLEISRDNIVSLTGPNQILTVRVDPQDSVIVPPLSVLQPHGGFVTIDVGFLDSELTVVSRSTDDDDDPVLVFAGSDWTNPLDVND
ncbi:MAG: choice-of-anchor Q domain-containing protein, partial [Planctomycetota bacterium]